MSGEGQRFAICGDKYIDGDEMGQLHPDIIKELKKKTYFCVSCPTSHKVTFNHHKASRYWTHGHFSHAPEDSVRLGTGESDEHIEAKFLLQKHAGRYGFQFEQCEDCGDGQVHESTDAEVVIEDGLHVNGKYYRCDCMLKRHGRSVVAMEVFHTHKTTDEKMQAICNHGIGFVEFEAKHIIKKLWNIDTIDQGIVCLENIRPSYYLCDKCERTRKERAWQEREERARQEREERARQEQEKRARQEREERACTCVQRRTWRKWNGQGFDYSNPNPGSFQIKVYGKDVSFQKDWP